ncbi:MAG: hypothetical protein ACLFQX_08285 [Candidatus Kapaibacterium sp.]
MKSKSKINKVTQLEKQDRILILAKAYLKGRKSYNDLFRLYCRDVHDKDGNLKYKGWGISRRQFERYMSEVRDYIHDSVADALDINEEFKAMYLELYDVYQQARKDKDLKTSLGALKQIADLLGLEAPIRIESRSTITLGEIPDDLAEELEYEE